MTHYSKITSPSGPDKDGNFSISFYLGRNEQIQVMKISEKEAEKLIEDLMKLIWENKISKFNQTLS